MCSPGRLGLVRTNVLFRVGFQEDVFCVYIQYMCILSKVSEVNLITRGNHARWALPAQIPARRNSPLPIR